MWVCWAVTVPKLPQSLADMWHRFQPADLSLARPLYFLPSDSFGAKCSIIFNLCCAHLLPHPINPCQPQRQMEADDCTLSINIVEFLSQILRTLPEVYSEGSDGLNGSQFTDGPSHTSISDKHSCNNHRLTTHWLLVINKPVTFIKYFKTFIQE